MVFMYKVIFFEAVVRCLPSSYTRRMLWPVRAWFLSVDVCMHVCLCVCPPPGLLITSSVMWCDMDPLNKFYGFCMAAVVGIVSGCGFSIHMRCEN